MNKIIFIGSILLSIANMTESQSRWVKQYNEGLSAPGNFFSTSYDCGYLLTGRVLPAYKYTWLIKTDVDGDILWEKFIGGNYSRVSVERFTQNDLGDIYLCGDIIQEGQYDPFIIKLNACGEKQWCNQLSTTSNYDFYSDIVSTPDGGCAALIFGAFYPQYNFRTGILRFSPDGDLLWQQYYQSSDQGIDNEELSNLILTPDSGFLMTGDCYYPDPDNPDLLWLHPYFIKVNSVGNFEWEIVLHKETSDVGGQAWATIIDPIKKNYYSCISHYYHTNNSYSRLPALVKIDLDGNVIDVYDLVHEDYDWGGLNSAAFINDSLLAGGACWFNNENGPQSRAIIFDTLGNIRDSLTLLNTGWLSKTAVTNDGKLLFYNTIEENGDFDTYLFKLTQDLEQDTFYTTPFVYDSLCPYQIASDTIVPDDCGVIVGMEEHGGKEEHGGMEAWGHGGMEVWPNPCREVLNVKVLGLSSGIPYYVSIYDIFGREVQKIKVPDRKGNFQANLTAYSPGVYIAILRNETDILSSKKFVVAH
jgi:hypothetical protein